MSEKKKMNPVLSFLLRFGISFGLIGFIATKIDWEKTWDVVKNADPLYLFYSFLVFLGAHVIVFSRWWLIIKGLELKVPFTVAFRYFFIGLFGNLFLPSAIGGDVIRIWGLCQNCPEKPKVVASVLLDRMTGMSGVVIVGVVSYIVGFKLINDVALFILMLGVAAIAIAIFTVLFNEKIYSFFSKAFNIWPNVKAKVMTMHHDIAFLKDRKLVLFTAIAMACCIQTGLALIYFFMAKALNQDVHLGYFLIFIPLICVVSTVPTIGGLGAREAGAVYLFAKVGISAGVAVSLSLMNFVYMVVLGLVGGVLYMTTKTAKTIPPEMAAGEV